MVKASEELPQLLVANLSRELILSVAEALEAGARRAFSSTKGMARGHRASALGGMRHFEMNETFHDALTACDASPSKLVGNKIILGRTGIFQLGRANISVRDPWARMRRSKSRLNSAMINEQIELATRPDLFQPAPLITEGLVLFVAYFAEAPSPQQETPFRIEVAIPDKSLKSWLYQESVEKVLSYFEPTVPQEDKVKPTLKKGVKKQNDSGEQ